MEIAVRTTVELTPSQEDQIAMHVLWRLSKLESTDTIIDGKLIRRHAYGIGEPPPEPTFCVGEATDFQKACYAVLCKLEPRYA